MTTRDRRCGWLVDHDEHDWQGTEHVDDFLTFQPRRRVTFHCKGHVVTEGGWTRCEGCGTSGPPHPVGGVECRETAREKAREKAISQGDE